MLGLEGLGLWPVVLWGCVGESNESKLGPFPLPLFSPHTLYLTGRRLTGASEEGEDSGSTGGGGGAFLGEVGASKGVLGRGKHKKRKKKEKERNKNLRGEAEVEGGEGGASFGGSGDAER